LHCMQELVTSHTLMHGCTAHSNHHYGRCHVLLCCVCCTCRLYGDWCLCPDGEQQQLPATHSMVQPQRPSQGSMNSYALAAGSSSSVQWLMSAHRLQHTPATPAAAGAEISSVAAPAVLCQGTCLAPTTPTTTATPGASVSSWAHHLACVWQTPTTAATTASMHPAGSSQPLPRVPCCAPLTQHRLTPTSRTLCTLDG
jgi:hypothetical protein